jgi:spermidine/putrescine ABC transporter ATP-binding subunit
MSSITLEGLTKVFGEVRAVDGVSLKVEDSEFVTLLGPSGCGKTTILRMIAGLEKPTSGKIYMDGRDITNLPPYERSVGMVFQSLALFPHLTVFGNIAYGMRINRRRRYTKAQIKARVREMLELVELEGMEGRYPSQLSGGQQQRVALARALAHNPSVLLLDESLANLDRKLRERMQVELRRIQQKVGITTVFVTHDQDEAMTMSDRIAVMRSGRIVQVGAPTKIYESPNSIFVAGFIGTMNFFDGEVADVAGEVVRVRCDDFELLVPRRGKVKEDQKVTIAVRPESIRFVSSGNHTLRGKIDLKRHLGDTIEYHIYSDDNDKEIIVTKPRGAELDFDEGETVQLLLPSESCLLFEVDAGR